MRDRRADTPTTEAAIKCAVIDRLFEKGEVAKDAVLISEMVIDNWARRADVVLANGKLSAFEIKSDLDTLERLPGQIESYRSVFERVVVVVAPRFAEKVEQLVPEGVGIWIAEGDTADQVTERKRAKTFDLAPDAAIRLMSVTDLRLLLRSNGVSGAARAPRRELEDLATNLTKKDLACAAREAVKRRFRAHFNRFVSCRQAEGTRSALAALKRIQRTPPRALAMEVPDVPEVTLPTEHPLLVNAPAGPILKRAV